MLQHFLLPCRLHNLLQGCAMLSLSLTRAARPCGARRARYPARSRPCRSLVRSDADFCVIGDYSQPREPPSPEKRRALNLMLAASLALPTSQMAYTYLSALTPPREGGAGGSQPARDALGNIVLAERWLAAHPAGDRSLVQGLQGDATYLIVTDDGGLQAYGLNSICTHLGCVVPWNAAENRFICPCHGSQYNAQGKKMRGPAPLPLALVHTEVDGAGAVQLSPWTEEDFRTGEKPWWA